MERSSIDKVCVLVVVDLSKGLYFEERFSNHLLTIAEDVGPWKMRL